MNDPNAVTECDGTSAHAAGVCPACDQAFAELMDDVLVPHRVVENDRRANVARLELLASDARKKRAAADDPAVAAYWRGMESGLGRAVNVLEGRG